MVDRFIFAVGNTVTGSSVNVQQRCEQIRTIQRIRDIGSTSPGLGEGNPQLIHQLVPTGKSPPARAKYADRFQNRPREDKKQKEDSKN